MNKKLEDFFKNLSAYLEASIKPISNELDYDDALLTNAYQQLRGMGNLKFLIPTEYGGLGGERADWIEYNIQLSMYSGALLFLQAQHQFAISQLKKLLPHNNVKKILQRCSDTNKGIAISLAANRRLIQVDTREDGFVLSGKLPWVTGMSYYDDILFSFDDAGMSFYALLPFQAMTEKNGSLEISKRIETAVFNSTNTVSVDLVNWFIPKKNIIAAVPVEPIKPLEHPAIYNFAGAAKALLEIATQGKYFEHQDVKAMHDLLSQEWQAYYAKIIEEKTGPLELRMMGFRHAERCATFARMVCGSVGVLASHPLTRISREIWQYTVAGYSHEQLKAYAEGYLGQGENL